LPFAVEVIAFTDEEGLRFHTSYLGSSAVAGAFDPQWLAIRDAEGISMAEALAAAGGDPEGIPGCAYRPESVLGYCEVHIEQGPLLEARDLPVGVVSAIAGQSRATIGFQGVAGHAGTVPMALRHDALCAAAEFILAVEAIARAQEGLVATIGQIAAQPGAGNVIPGLVTLSLDLRHQDDATRLRAYEVVQARAGELARRRGVRLAWEPLQESPATACSPRLAGLLAEAVEAQGPPVLRLSSGAGHDGVALAALTEIAMLFVRCKGGISHNPAESVAAADVGVAIEVLAGFLDLMTAAYA
jgi:allantoate deiminase